MVLTANSRRHSRSISVIASFARKLGVCFLLTMVFVMSLQIISRSSLEALRGLVPHIEAAISLKGKLAKQLKAIENEQKRDSQLSSWLLGRMMWLVIQHATLLFFRSLQTFFLIIAGHHYGAPLMYQAGYWAPDWLTELAGMHGNNSQEFDIEPPPALKLDSRLVSIEGGSKNCRQNTLANANANGAIGQEAHPGAWWNGADTDAHASSASSSTSSSSRSSPKEHGAGVDGGSPRERRRRVERKAMEDTRSTASNGSGSGTGSNCSTTGAAADEYNTANNNNKVRFADGSTVFSRMDSSVSEDSHSPPNEARDPNWWVYDPQFGVVTAQCRDKWRQQEQPQGTAKPKSPRPLPPVRFT